MIEEGECNKEQIVAKEIVDQRNVWLQKKKLVTFIAWVINATSEITSKPERIQIIKAAVHHLDMTGEVRDELSVQSGQESACLPGC